MSAGQNPKQFAHGLFVGRREGILVEIGAPDPPISLDVLGFGLSRYDRALVKIKVDRIVPVGMIDVADERTRLHGDAKTKRYLATQSIHVAFAHLGFHPSPGEFPQMGEHGGGSPLGNQIRSRLLDDRRNDANSSDGDGHFNVNGQKSTRKSCCPISITSLDARPCSDLSFTNVPLELPTSVNAILPSGPRATRQCNPET